MKGRKGVLAVLLLALLAQVGLRLATDSWKPRLEMVPTAPSKIELAALSFGDREAGYRLLLQQLQDFGDTGGRFSSLRGYDYGRVVDWLRAVYRMDGRSDGVLAVAASVYGQSPDPAQVRQIALFLEEACRYHEERMWRWLVEAAYLAKYRAHDQELARAIAQELAVLKNPELPDWVHRMPELVEAPERGRTLPTP